MQGARVCDIPDLALTGLQPRRASKVASPTTRFRALEIVRRATRCKITIRPLVVLGVSARVLACSASDCLETTG